MADTSASLLDRLRGGDQDSWDRLVCIYTPLLRTWIRRAGVRPDDVDDLVQDVLSILVRKLPEFSYNPMLGSFRGWLKTLTVRRVRDHWKSRRGQAEAGGGSAALDMLAELEDPASALSRAWDH
jgi:RNA polymerase sigma-70 factor (ECF subfamily)